MGRLPTVNASVSLDPLTQILTRESLQCDLLARNIVQERDAIKRMALHEFVSINQSRLSILECLHSLKEDLDAFVDHLAAAYCVPEDRRTLAEIVYRTGNPQAGVILEQYEGLAKKVRAVKQDIEVNQLLIKNTQAFFIRAMEAHRQPELADDLYSVVGSQSKQTMPAALIRRQG